MNYLKVTGGARLHGEVELQGAKNSVLPILAATLLTAATISSSGTIGWVGLVIPHMTRKLTGSETRYLLPGTALMGGIFLLVVDNVSRTLLPVELPIGILTAFIGAPFFLWMMVRRGGAR